MSGGLRDTLCIIIAMDRIKSITLDNALPEVFVGAEKDAPLCHSRVWLQHLELARPGHYMVIAESGTGKSSLCSFIYGSRRDYRGQICFDGVDIREYSVRDWCEIRRRHISLLPQEMRLFPELTAMENILIKNRLTDCYSEGEIMEMLARVEIDHKAGQRAGLLSIGQQQRVAIVRALCQPFDFIILDEPVSHLDSRNNAIVAALVADVAASRDAAVIATSVGNHLQLDSPQIIQL